MTFELPKLPYDDKALEPHISAETIEYHYGKHHKAYVDKLNAAVEGNSDLSGKSLEEIISKATGGVFNNAAQVWNHTFYWHCLSPNGGGNPTGKIAELISTSFGSFDKFKEEFSNSAANNFGSGWTWLIKEGNSLKIVNTDDADTPIKDGKQVILTIDVWEHAYYIDYRNARPKYIEAFWNLVNWEFANSNL